MENRDLRLFEEFCLSTSHVAVRAAYQKRFGEFRKENPSSGAAMRGGDGLISEQGRALIRGWADEAIQEVAPQLNLEQREWLREFCLASTFGLGPLDLLLSLNTPILDLVFESNRSVRIRENEDSEFRELPIGFLDEQEWFLTVERICAPNGWRLDEKYPVLQREWRGWVVEAVRPSRCFGEATPRSPWLRFHRGFG